MISFVTLFLGLVTGPQAVQVAVGPEVAAVQLLLDGEPAPPQPAPPGWRSRVDFGEALLPHRLEAVALDADGQEIGRATQWANLPLPAAAVTLSLAGPAEGSAHEVRLAWESLDGAAPTTVTVSFDGVPLRLPEGADGSAWPLPGHDPAGLHFLQARVEFADALIASGELLFGGGMREEVSSSATAVPILPARRRELRLPDLAGALVGDTGPLRALALEGGPLKIVVVVDPSAAPLLAAMRPAAPRSIGELRGPVAARPLAVEPTLDASHDWRLELLWASPSRRQGAQRAYDLFPHSQTFTAEDGPLPWLLSSVRPPPPEEEPRLAEAVAAAGLAAGEGNLRRAVVLLLGPEPAAPGPLGVAAARRFLAALRVPLRVWSLQPAGAATDWGPAEAVSSPASLERLTGRLLRELARQRMLWLEGLHLPQSVRTAAGGEELLSLAGAGQ